MFRNYLFISLIFSSFSAFYSVNGYPALPPAFAFQPSQQHLAMAAAGIEPILPINYPGGQTMMTHSPNGRHSSMLNSQIPLSFFAGANRNGDQQYQQLPMAMGNQNQPQMFIRNSPYQPSPFRYATSLQGLQQPIFPQGMAIGKSAYGMNPSSAILPSDIPMDVLIGRQIVQNGLDGISQTVNGRHPFPLNPIYGDQINSIAHSSSSFGGAFGTDTSRNQQQPAEEKPEFESKAEMEQRISEQPTSSLPSSADSNASGQSHQFIPSSVTNAESSSINSSPSEFTQSTQNSLPIFLRGAQQEFIDEFKRIIRQPNSTYASQVTKIDELVQKMDPERQLMYREFMRENDERERLHRDRVHKTVAEMSDKAQEQFAKISATLRNPNMPDQERWDRVLQIYGKMEPDLRNEFEQKFKGFPTISPQ